MKRIKSFRLFENSEYDYPDKFIEEILFDITDSGDIPLSIETTNDKCLILIGSEDNPRAKDIPLHLYIDNLTILNEYMLGEGWTLRSIACWIKPAATPITGVRPITAGDFDKFLEKIQEVKIWNEKHPPIEWKTFKLVDICYEVNQSI
jgi:hypothetical protein